MQIQKRLSSPVHIPPRMRLRVGSFMIILGIFLVVLGSCRPIPTPPPTVVTTPDTPMPSLTPEVTLPEEFWITGSLTAFSDNVFFDVLYIPGVKVGLVDLATNTELETTMSDLGGHFRFAGLPPGEYQVCWEAQGFIPDCSDSIKIVDEHRYLDPIPMFVKEEADVTSLFGKVRFTDISIPRTLEPFANVNAFAIVETIDSSGNVVTPPVYVNDYGDYFIPLVPTTDTLILRSTIEGLTEDLALDPSFLSSSRLLQQDINLSNHPPRLTGMVAGAPGGTKWTAAPGDTVDLSATATDKDGDTVEFRWVIPDGLGTLSSELGDTVQWQVPNFETNVDVTVVAFDKKGGYAKQSILFSTVPALVFSGQVDATDTSAVEGAEVEIGGVTAVTDAGGFFYMTVPETNQYVLNIRADGYGLVSEIYDKPVYGGHWTLKRGTTHVVDPTTDIDVGDDLHGENCQGSLTSRVNWGELFPNTQFVEFRDHEGNVLREQMNPENGLVLPTDPANPEEKLPCGPGMQVRIPANSLVDANGNPPAAGTMLTLTLVTADLDSPEGMPGDYSATTAAGDPMVMQSFGAGYITVTDGTQPYNLASGASAEVILPIAPAHFAAGGPIPDQIPILYYNETTGIWEEDASMIGQRVGDTYAVKVAHFSEINADELKVNQSCIRIDSPIMPETYKLQVTIPQPGGSPRVIAPRDIDNGNARFHVIYNLPSNTDITLTPFQVDGTPIGILSLGPFQQGGIDREEVTSVTVNSGGPQSPTTPNRPEFPYAACQSSVELIQFKPAPEARQLFLSRFDSALNIDLLEPTDPTQPNPLRDALLNGLNQYYATIDPDGNRETLEEFKTFNGFGGPDEIAAVYSNSGDLGFGREMHCVRNPVTGTSADVACYVSNFGNRFTADSADVEDAARHFTDGSRPIVATVAMEYSRIEDGAGGFLFGGARVVKFYVYPGNVPTTPRVSSADLDGSGQRPVPQLCIICHGGDFIPASTGGGVTTFDASNVNVNAVFLPFDLQGFGFAPDTTIEFPDLTKANQQEEFRRLNQEIVLVTQPGPGIVELINAMYAGGAATQDENFIVSGWTSAPDVYRDVIGPSCRTCHTALGNSDIDWREAQEVFDRSFAVNSFVCNQHIMPHAVVTHNRFWLSIGPHQPQLLHDFLNGSTDCVPPP